MREVDTSSTPASEIDALLRPPTDDGARDLEATVRAIIEDVRSGGDKALVEYTRRFDWKDATADQLEIARREIDNAESRMSIGELAAPRRAAQNIVTFHRAELGRMRSWFETGPGTLVGQKLTPVERVGIYIPGAKALYPSSVLMTAIPASVAGALEIVLCTPPGPDGAVASSILALAAPYVTRVFRAGGAQAIAAMAYGTETIPAVDVIVGPGNAYVNEAKRQVYGQVGIDMLAGPSEVAIIADDAADPELAAADVLAQIEHGPDNRAFVLSPCAAFLVSCRDALVRQRSVLKRQEILAATDANLVFIGTATMDEAVTLSNRLAPEHLELMVREPLAMLASIRNAGAILLGGSTSAPIGDYMAGPSHTLPTAGRARFSSPLSVATFLKRQSVISYGAEAAASTADLVAAFATMEGFDGHANAALLRKSVSTTH